MRAALMRLRPVKVLENMHHDGTLDVSLNYCPLQHVALSYGSYGAAIHVEYDETDVATQIFPLRGSGSVATGRAIAPIEPDSSITISPNTGMTMESASDYERFTLDIAAPALMAKLAALTGTDVIKPLKLDLFQRAEQASAWHLRELLFFFVNLLSSTTGPPLKLVIAELEQALMVAFLRANRHNYSTLLEKRPEEAAPWQVRRAEEYIEANWHRPIRIEDVAAVSGTSTRSLFRTFQRFRGCTPMGFVKQVRLDHADRLLRSGDATRTVTSVAFDCGFNDVARFGSDYRSRFGQLPSETLKQARVPFRRVN